MSKRVLLVSVFIIIYLDSLMCKPSEFDTVAEETKEFEEGAGKLYAASQQSAQGETGEKGYVAQHANEKGEIGHHDKERHQKEYAEEGGAKKSHNHDDGYYAADHNQQHGENGYHYVDKGSYAKGHDTKGHHNIQKLDEFKKKKEFFDEDHDGAHKEKHGGYDIAKGYKDGEFKYGGHAKKIIFEGEFGATGKSENGAHNFEEAGHNKAQRYDEHFKDAEEFAKKGSDAFFKEFEFGGTLSH